MGVVVSLAVAIPVVGAVVLFVRRTLRSHTPSEEELRRLERERESVDVMQLPTLTTEMTGKVARDPDFELDANTVRNRQGF